MKKKVAIIFGSGGQDGYYLSELLSSAGLSVIKISRNSGDVIGDVSDRGFVEANIKFYIPDFIFHFAAVSSTKHDFIFQNNEAISNGTINILESARLFAPNTKIFLSGSALQFKNIGIPIDEKAPFDLTSTYSISRIHSVYMGRYFREKFGIKVYIGYFFNHDSPLRDESHINQKIIAHAIKIKNGSTDELIIGDIEIKKEFNYAKDIMNAVWILMNQEIIFEAVIGCGKSYTIREWLEYIFKKLDLKWENHIRLNNSYISEYKELVSNPEILKKIGWEPKTTFYELADMMLESELTKK
jgi:GDPmannose 4,6-dehydratase